MLVHAYDRAFGAPAKAPEGAFGSIVNDLLALLGEPNGIGEAALATIIGEQLPGLKRKKRTKPT